MCKECNNRGLELNLDSDKFELIVRTLFEQKTKERIPVFLTDCNEKMYDIYLDNLEDEEVRNYFNCNACKAFISRYATLCTVNDNDEIESLLWNITSIPDIFKKSTEAMNNAVKKSNITTIFRSDLNQLGTPLTGPWSHLYVSTPSFVRNRARNLSAGQVMAEYRERYSNLEYMVNKYNTGIVSQAVELIENGSLYRADVIRGVAEWFNNLKFIIDRSKDRKTKKNLLWSYVESAPEGFCNINSSMFGTLLKDLKEAKEQGTLTYDDIIKRFKSKMDPSQYQRSQSAPTVASRDQAEKYITQLGLADSLLRRYAKFEEIPEFIWKSTDDAFNKPEPTSGGIFSNVVTKDKPKNVEHDLGALPQTTMTWDKFCRTVLPFTVNMEAKTDNTNRFMALITAQVPDSENIIQWDNQFTWYYHGGADAEMKRRLDEFGARSDNNKMRCSLMWNGLTDLDLHCYNSINDHISYNEKRDSLGAYLDLDMNGLDKHSEKPVENIRWKDHVPDGKYMFVVHNYAERVDRYGTPYIVELEIDGKVYTYNGEPLQNHQSAKVFEFIYSQGKEPMFINLSETQAMRACEANTSWNIPSNRFVKVNGITKSPNTWGDSNNTKSGDHTFFILDGCKDVESNGKGRGFFNEFLKTEFRPFRKTLEAYTAGAEISGIEESTACGLGFSTETDWNLVLKVETTNGTTKLIKIDRFD